MRASSSTSRIKFLDWLRGLAAIIMLQGHTFHSFLRPEDRNHPAFIFSQFFGGQAAAIFLLLTGVTYGLGMNRREHLSPWRRVTAALKRARYLFLLAFLFRIQTWAFAWPHSSWKDLLKVDVLNTMGATAVLLAVVALVHGMDRARLAAGAGIAIAALSPVIAGLDTGGVPWMLRAYFVPSADYFSVFPWGAYLAFGLAAGSAIPRVERGDWSRVMQWAALVGFALLLGGQYFSNLPYSIYSHSDFWLNSPALVACKLGDTLLLGAGAFLWTEYFSTGWSFVQQLGTTSLVVYWVHVELTYGRWLESYKERLGIWGCVAASVAMIALMVGVSIAVTRVPWRRLLYTAKARLHPQPVPVEDWDEILEPAGVGRVAERVYRRR
jgi:uncharacterized membrane protein